MSAPLTALVTALADRYRIERELGAGGMATVYLAHDLKHDRKVAVKVLRPELAMALGPERFLREITTTANLRHPHILPLFDSGAVGQEGGTSLLYYVMPFLEGESLRDRMSRERQLNVADALRLAGEVADALGYAHERGIIHRDIKPENILLERGHAVVADFGIALAVSEAGDEKLTRTGTAIGTPWYMSPEQSVGERDLDGRSDLYSLGSVLYEMLGGEPPYVGSTAQAIIAKRFTEPVPRITTLRETVPPAVEAALNRVLAKAPADRFATAAEFADALATLTPASPARKAIADPPSLSIAVLPFANMSADPEDEYFADGITEEIINALGQVPGLKVAARASCFAFKGKREDLRVIAEKLGVGKVLEGSVRKAGARVRITAQLATAADGMQLWSERYDRTMEDIFAVQDEVAGAIATRLQLSLASGSAARAQPTSAEGYELLLKGRVLLNRRGRSIMEAREVLERAVIAAPGSADAHALLGDCYRLHGVYGIAAPAAMVPKARAMAECALALEPEHVEALATLSNIAGSFEWDTAKCVAYADRALARDPSHVRVRAEKALWHSLLDRQAMPIEAVLAELEIARQLDPLNPWVLAMRAIALLFDDRPAEALADSERGVSLDPTNFTARWTLVDSLGALGRHADAFAAAEPALAMSGRNAWILAEVAALHATRGDQPAAEAVYQELKKRAMAGYLGWAEQAAVAASAGHLPEARAMAQKALAGREAYPLFWKLPGWGPLRADPEGYRILRSTGL